MRRLIINIKTTTVRLAVATVTKLALATEVDQGMKMMRILLLAGMISMFCCSLGNAQIIYSNVFNGGATRINRTAPTLATNLAGGTVSAWWNCVSNSATSIMYKNGTVGTGENSVLLPFTPELGYVYTLTASVTVPTMTAGQWITMGFAATNPPLNTATDPRFGSTYVVGNPWTYLTEGSGGDFFFPLRGTTTGNAELMPTNGTYTVQLVLNTTGGQWTSSEYVNGTQVGTTYTYNPNPEITAVGVGQTTLSSSTGIQWNSLTLEATGTRTTSTVNATVSFSGTGKALNPSFVGLSYEKLQVTTDFFTSNNVPLIDLLSLLGPGVLRIGGGTVDTTGWGGISNTIPITAAQVDALAGFVNALQGNWKVIYGLNLESNTADNCEAEAVYAANDLGSNLLGFEIGNEPEFGFSTYSSFLGRWRLMAAACTNHVPDWAVTNGGAGWILDGADAGQGQLSAYTDPFASNESGVASLLTQHFYVASAGAPNDTMQQLFLPNPSLVSLVTNIVGAATGNCSLGARISECGSYSGGGILGVSDAYGAALWSLDYMFTVALNGGQGVNFHGGGRSPYSPLVDNGTNVTAVNPEFYGLEMFSLVPPGNVVPTTVALATNINFTAYGVKCTSGGISTLLNNKEVNDTVAVSVNLGTNVSGAILYELTGASLFDTNDYTLGGATINPDGTWGGDGQAIVQTSNGQLTVNVPPMSAYLLNPVTVGTKPAAVTPGPYWNLRATLTTGPADFIYHYGGSNDTLFVIGDWNGNGTMTPGVVRTNSSGQWEWLLSNSDGGGATYDFVFGNAAPGDVLVVGDWDGNGTWTPGIVRTNSTGQLEWLLCNTNLTSGSATTNDDFVYGDAGDTPFVGDWDGNGTFTPGCVKAGSNTWALRNENSGGVADITFGYGNGTGIPIVGDWDGNGTWTCGIIEGNTWELRNENTSGGAEIVFGYGSPGDIFLVW